MGKENSTLKIKDSRVYENGTESQSYPQIYVENSKAEISNSLVYDSKGRTGIYGKASQITINGSEIHGNKGNGIKVKENSTLKIKDSRIYENGTEGQSYAQIWVGNSEVKISTSLVYDSKGGTGIYGTASQIAKNDYEFRGLWTRFKWHLHFYADSTLIMEGSQVYKNGADEAQIDIYGLCQVTIRDTHVYNSKGDYGIWIEKSGSKVELINVKTWGNKYGLKCKEYGTSVLIKNCEFKDGTFGLG
jgi:hypothetical protein